jgi:cardiolipin synthase
VGTVNLDFRSLYLHFECGAWMYRTAVIGDIKADFENTFPKCREIQLEDCKKSFARELFRAVMALIAPMI